LARIAFYLQKLALETVQKNPFQSKLKVEQASTVQYLQILSRPALRAWPVGSVNRTYIPPARENSSDAAHMFD